MPSRDEQPASPREVKVAFASGSEDLIPTLIERLKELEPVDLPLYVVSEFPPPEGQWVPYHPARTLRDNWMRCRAAFRGQKVRFSGIILQPRMPYWRMRLVGFLLSPAGFIAYNENLDHFMLRPRSLGTILRHFRWRAGNFVRWETQPGGTVYTFLWRLRHPRAFLRPLYHLSAVAAGWAAAVAKRCTPPAGDRRVEAPLAPGVTVVVPSRNGRHLLERLLPGLREELEGLPHELIVVDNGSDDGTGEWLARCFPQVAVELEAAPLSFARAVNRGIRRARYSRLCLLNNDMVLERGFFPPLLSAFTEVPGLFCATAQILFPEGQRRQETGKAVYAPRKGTLDFPVRCNDPVPGENLSYVLYGSGGCSMYDTAKLRALGAIGEIYEPAYVEDLDAGYRAWLRGWPSVFVAASKVLHEHQATASRYFSAADLSRILEVNWLRFLCRAVASPRTFRRLWGEAIRRLNGVAALQDNPYPWAEQALAQAWRAPSWTGPPPAVAVDDELVLAIGSGSVTVFPGRARSGRPVVLVASPYAPFPLSHGGAVRMYNLMRAAAEEFDLVLVCFSEKQETPPRELLDLCIEIVQVWREGTHLYRTSPRPDEVEEFDRPAFRAALRQTVRKWRPAIAQLEYTQMGQYARDCSPARTILVEHDITFDLYEQLLRQGEDWETRYQFERWRRFETEVWRDVDCVVTMSEKDRRVVRGGRAECLPNGVDLARFRPSADAPEPGRILFIGSFAHLPNILAVEFFLREVWPGLEAAAPVLHIIAGSRHRYFLERHADKVSLDLHRPRIEVEDFVADVRPAYERAALVVAPLIASAGTNIKIMEAMAMGKAIVSTPAGINGLDLADGVDVLVTPAGGEMAEAILGLLRDPERRRAIERQARATVADRYDWNAIGGKQAAIYRSLTGGGR